MSDAIPSERFEELQRQVNQRVQQALSELRQEFGERLRKAGDQIVGELGREIEGVSPELPATFLSVDELAPVAAEAEERAQRDAHSQLTAALAAVDRAGSQAEVLRVLTREAHRFADRSAVLLTRADGLELWDAAGWGEDGADGIALPFAEDGPWSRDALGSGAAELSGDEAARLSDLIGSGQPAAAVLVPLVLRDRLAAVVYADAEDAGAPHLEALQALTYTAALALETLPFRERESTPTLGRAGGGAPPVAPLPAQRAPQIEVQPDEPEEETHEDLPTIAQPTPAFAEEETADEAAVAAAMEDAEAAEDAAAAEEGGWELEDEATPSVPQAAVGELEVSEPEELEVGEEPAAFGDDMEVDLDAEVELEDDVELEGDLETEDLRADDLESGVDREVDLEIEEPEIEEPEIEEPEIEEPEIEEPAVDDEEPVAGEPEVEGESTAEERPAATAGFEAPGAPPTGGEEASAPTAPPPAPAAEAKPTAAGGSQVAPPSDLEGPGRAFGAVAAEEAEGGDEARHEEARRLARLLVSEIRLYNEEEVEEGRRNNDIYQRLKEDIDRSRQMYDERVDPSLRDSTDYFYEELVRNLGGGDAASLGI